VSVSQIRRHLRRRRSLCGTSHSGCCDVSQVGVDMGKAQFYKILDTILDAAGGSPETGMSTLAPPGAIPTGAIVIAFSTLLDTDFALSLIDLRKRGHTVVAIDMLVGTPFTDAHDPLVTRMWSLQRSFMHRDMGTIGVDVVPWSPEQYPSLPSSPYSRWEQAFGFGPQARWPSCSQPERSC
jgi:uncharacterized protein (DUF58 family)